MGETIAAAINAALHAIFESDARVHLVGEDLLDPYGGAFRISRGLSTRWPDRVLPTPISEAAIVGVCGGLALRGLRAPGQFPRNHPHADGGWTRLWSHAQPVARKISRRHTGAQRCRSFSSARC